MKVYKNPVERKAIQFTGSNWDELMLFVGSHKDTGAMWDIVGFNPIGTYLPSNMYEGFDAELWVQANDSWVPIKRGEWVIKDSEGFYPCKEYVFAETYSTTPPENLHYDEGTMTKVYTALVYAGCGRVGEEVKSVEVVSALQNAGILFRERGQQ